MTAIKVYDLETGEQRDSSRQDLITNTRVADALPNIDAVCPTCKIVEQSDVHGEIEEFLTLVENTSKPLEFLCEYPDTLKVVIEIAAAIRGGRDQLAQKPYFMHIVTPLPLYYAKDHTDQIMMGIEAGIPMAMGTVTIAGASTPITTAGCLVHCMATDLAGIVLGQLVKPGTFCIGGSDAGFMEPATGCRGGFSQVSLAEMALCQMCRSLGIPSLTGVGGPSKARRFNQDAAWQISANMMQTFYSRPANCDYLGLIDDGISYSLHALLYGHELAGLLRQMWKGFEVDDDALAMDLSLQEAPFGNYLAHQHTVDHCRSELWDVRYFGANLPVSTSGKPDLDLFERIDADLKEIIRTHRPAPLDASVHDFIRGIQKDFRSAGPASG